MLGQKTEGLTCAVFSGSMSSGGGGVRAVLTAQKRQPLVHVSPALHHSNNNNNRNVYLTNRHQVHATQVSFLQIGLFRASRVWRFNF